MTTALAAPPRSSDAGHGAPTRPSRTRVVVLAALVLLAAYGVLTLLNDPRGTLGTDTGGKLASLDAMARNGDLDPDLGYWAEEWDPDGALHPLFYTRHVEGGWVNLTTLTMPVVARPLDAIGGTRAVLLLPMAGAVLAALAARALARRLDGEHAGWWAFWLVGLASPLAVYALDVWEHSLGVAVVLWASVLVFDVAERRAGWRGALGVGVLLGLAATMRTEALVYGAVIGLAALVALRGRGVPAAALVRLGVAAAGGVVGMLAANQVLERVVLGASLRAGRVADTVAAGGRGLGRRAEEAVTTLVGLNRFDRPLDWLLGAMVVGTVVYAAWRLASDDGAERRTALVALGAAALVYLLRFADGLGFVPGLLTAAPIAAAGLLPGAQRGARVVVVAALAALPVVWALQYSGGAGPQWGARYLLVSGALLAVVAAGRLAAARAPARLAIVALSVAVTACGVAWLSVRSHSVADAFDRIAARDDAVLVSREAHLLREGGAFYTPERRWLTATDDEELREAARVAAASRADELTLVGLTGRDRPAALGPFRAGPSDRLEVLPGFEVALTRYRVP